MTGGCKSFPGACPARLCAGVHLRILRPATEANTFWTSAKQNRLHVDPHNLEKSSPTLLCEVPPSEFTIRENRVIKQLKRAEGYDIAAEPAGSLDASARQRASTLMLQTKKGMPTEFRENPAVCAVWREALLAGASSELLSAQSFSSIATDLQVTETGDLSLCSSGS
eukprot:s3807_g7.t1